MFSERGCCEDRAEHPEKEERARQQLGLVDEEYHASCQAILKGIEGEEWERLYSPFARLFIK